MNKSTVYSVKGEYRELLYTLEYYANELQETGQEYIDLVAMKAMVGSDYYWCKNSEAMGEKYSSNCGWFCDNYKPRNGKNGICTHNGPVYEDTEKEYRLYKSGKLEKIK